MVLTREALPTGTITFLFTDIQGSTPLWEREPEGMKQALEIHNLALRGAIQANGGSVFKKVGDEFQVAFPTVPQALQAAIEGQKALRAAPWNELGELKVRMGIHTGQAELDPDGDEYAVSHTKNRAARIMSAAQGGQVLLSLAAAELLRGHLPIRVSLKDLGEHRLKGLLLPEHLYQVLAPDLPTIVAPLNAQTPLEANRLEAVIALAREAHLDGDFDFLDSTVFSISMTETERAHFIRLLRFTWNLQNQNPIYEAVYQHLVFIYVLNGSRLDLLRKIDRRLHGLEAGQSAIVLVSGVSGIGKTSLVMAFQERILQLGMRLLQVHCSSQDNLPYSLWRDAVHAIAAEMDVPLEALPAPIGLGIQAQSPQQLRLNLDEWLRQRARVRPLVILLDDLHWADADSLEVLEFLTRQSNQPPILYIATYRSEASFRHQPLDDYLPELRRNRQHDYLRLLPLDQDDLERLVNVYHGPCEPELVQYLQNRAEGSPLFTVELLNDLVDQGMLPQDDQGRWLAPEQSAPVPGFLKQLISQRVNRLGEGVEMLLSTAAVFGEVWKLGTVEALLDMTEDDLLEALEAALGANLITVEEEQSETYRFSHGITRQVLYNEQLPRRRKRLHGRIAAQLEQDGNPQANVIAYHLMEAEQWEKAVGYCLKAGEESVQLFAYRSALDWYQEALKAAENAGDAIEPGILLNIYHRLGRAHLALEQREQAELVYSRMQAVAQSNGDLTGEGYALLGLANARMHLYQVELAKKTGREAFKLGEQSGDLGLLMQAQIFMNILHITQGQVDEGMRYSRQVIQQAETIGDSVIVGEQFRFMAYYSIWNGQYSEAADYARQALQIAKNTVDPLLIAGALQNLGYSHIEAGKYLEAYQVIAELLEAGETTKLYFHQQPRLLNLMGYLHLELGDVQSALEWDAKAVEASQQHAQRALSVYEIQRYSTLNLATDYLHLGRLAEAKDAVVEFEEITEGAFFARFRYYNRYLLLMSEMYLAHQQYAQSIESAQEARELARSKGNRKNIAKSHWFEGQALAGLRQFRPALENLETAVAIVDEIQHGSLRWKIRLSQAEVLLQAGKSPAAVLQETRRLVDQVVQALVGSPLQKTFTSSKWIERLEALEKHSEPEKPTYPAGLTEREVEVLRLVAGGATNQQVAEVLHISVRTVNTHMTNILNKTGCDNRTAASTFAVQHRLV
jgi:predicted ATPase/class 3 adenylate cyclase/DNA-binding CsgD family transcriptional regulator